MTFVLEVAVALLMSVFGRNTPTAWIAVTHDGHALLACGDDDGAEIACDGSDGGDCGP